MHKESRGQQARTRYFCPQLPPAPAGTRLPALPLLGPPRAGPGPRCPRGRQGPGRASRGSLRGLCPAAVASSPPPTAVRARGTCRAPGAAARRVPSRPRTEEGAGRHPRPRPPAEGPGPGTRPERRRLRVPGARAPPAGPGAEAGAARPGSGGQRPGLAARSPPLPPGGAGPCRCRGPARACRR